MICLAIYVCLRVCAGLRKCLPNVTVCVTVLGLSRVMY